MSEAAAKPPDPPAGGAPARLENIAHSALLTILGKSGSFGGGLLALVVLTALPRLIEVGREVAAALVELRVVVAESKAELVAVRERLSRAEMRMQTQHDRIQWTEDGLVDTRARVGLPSLPPRPSAGPVRLP